MGHKDGLAHAEEHGVEHLDDGELVNVLEANRQTSIQKKMRAHEDMAVATIAELAEFGSSETVRRRSARDILEYSRGRPSQQVLHTGGGGGGGITVNVLSFGDGTRREVRTVHDEPEKAAPPIHPVAPMLEDAELVEDEPTEKPFVGVKVSARRAERARQRMEEQA